jgi:hypothetical protein
MKKEEKKKRKKKILPCQGLSKQGVWQFYGPHGVA